MVDIQNSKITDRLLEETKAQPYFDLPKRIADNIQPVLIVNPHNRVFGVTTTKSDTASSVFFLTSTTKDTYILAANLSIAKDVVSTSIFSTISLTQDGGAAGIFFKLNYEPVTAGNIQGSMNWAQTPIKLARGSNISITNSTAIASIDVSATIILVEVEVDSTRIQ